MVVMWCREKLETDRVKSQQELEEDRLWMREFLARERKQMQAEQALRDRQREELRRWLAALQNSSRAEALVRPSCSLVACLGLCSARQLLLCAHFLLRPVLFWPPDTSRHLLWPLLFWRPGSCAHCLSPSSATA